MRSVPHPTTTKELQRFLGMVNFYRRFLPVAAHTLQPLTEALKGIPKVMEWSEVMQESFMATCCPLRSCPWPQMHQTPTSGVSYSRKR